MKKKNIIVNLKANFVVYSKGINETQQNAIRKYCEILFWK